MDSVLFHEEQHLRTSKLMWVVIPAIVLAIAAMIYALVQQLAFDEPVGDDPLSNELMIVVLVPSILLMIALAWLLWASKLVTEVHDDGIYIQYVPYHRHLLTYKWSDLQDFQTREYRPIREFGGWGLRLSPFGGGMAYNVSGNQGLQLVLKSGKKILIGTQRRDELDAALKQIKLD